MSELEEHLFCECDECIRVYRGPLSNEMRPYYLKSEADKVIANRDYEIKNLKDSIGKLLKSKTEQIITEVMQKALIYGEGFVRVEDMMTLIIELRHQKYKRCLAMAWWCMTEYLHSKCLDFTNTEQWYWRRWHIRWRELAKKFKEAK